jgi:hypothetical protein
LATRAFAPVAALLLVVACGGSGTTPRDGSAVDTTILAPGPPPGIPDPHGTAPPAAVETVTVRVNRGAPGMAARIRWALSPDRRSLLIVEDPAGVEAEPVPNGFVFASEALDRLVQQDSVWDVAPDPRWTRLAWGRAFGPRPAERDSMSDAEWRRFASRIPPALVRAIGPRQGGTEPLIAMLRQRVFPSSGMTYAVALGVAHVLDVGSGGEPVPLRWDGWRIAWSADGATLAIGTAPTRVEDDAPATRWIVVRPPSGDSLHAASDPAAFRRVQWVEGPVLDISIEEPPRELVATRDRRFIAALVPNTGAREYDPKTRLVLYHLKGR